ncbi:MAG TPA: wax ester/triacylglycerol synthase family O-acyltransferase [Ilumatobacter sp.]|nr:wax ester/triacylglycerol synthase family O-acyltransferase [Ilumatobacter sp.]
MKQLGGMDANFLNMETPSTYGHVCSMTIYEPTPGSGGAGLEITKRTILSRMDQLEPFRRRLVTVPFGLDLPYWIDDPDFDIDYHVRHHAVPPPGTPQQLAEVVGRIVSRPLDRSRPLWELYVIEGVENGRYIAQLNKIHHATIDGAAGVILLSAMLDTDPTSVPAERPTERWPVEVLPTSAAMLKLTGYEYLRRPEKMIRLGVHAVRSVAANTNNPGLAAFGDALARPLPGPFGKMLRDRLRGDRAVEDELPKLSSRLAPRTPFNASIGPHRRFAYTSLSLNDAREIRRAFGVTFNDVVMALCAATLRDYLTIHDALPDEPLIAMVPISVRGDDEDDLFRNRVAALTCELATDEPDPVKRLLRISRRMADAKERFDAVSADALQDFTQFAPPAVAGQAMRLFSRMRIADRMKPPVNLIISNVPGPNHPLYSAGAQLKHFYPVSTIADGMGLNMTVQSYNGQLDFGFVGDRDLVPDLWVLIDLLHSSMKQLHELARAEHGGGTTSTDMTTAQATAHGASSASAVKGASGQQVAADGAKVAQAAKKVPTKKATEKKASAKRAPASKKKAPVANTATRQKTPAGRM